MLHKTQVIIKPQGYLYSYLNQKDCFIGIQSIPDKYNQYRLGTIFLRNFYTGFDYYNDQIVIGLNKGTVHAEIHGSSPNPFVVQKEKTGVIVFVMIFLAIMVTIALYFFWRARKIEKERTVIFASAESKKRYKNGVEIKASLNDSEVQEELLDSEDEDKK
jgi:hypothetical protein